VRLKSFRVHSFRSVEDSGNIEIDSVTALIGVNESGKRNLLLPLWKLRPAKDGEIKPTADYPRKSYNDFRGQEASIVFAEAAFDTDEETRRILSEKSGAPKEEFLEIHAERLYNGKYHIKFPNAGSRPQTPSSDITSTLERAQLEISGITPLRLEEDFSRSVRDGLSSAITTAKSHASLGSESLQALLKQLPEQASPAKSSAIGPRYAQLRDELLALLETLKRPLPGDIQEVRQLALNRLPHFVYYTNYGNFDS
jgi:hypothetical protein